MSSADDSEAATLWKVNRTIHELVKDRVSLLPLYLSKLLTAAEQGYQVADDEIHMDLATFKSHYANSGGSVEYVNSYAVPES